MSIFATKKRVKDEFNQKDRTASRWAGVSLVLALLCGLLGYGCITLANKVTVVPYIVQVDQHGYEVNIGPLKAPDTVDERVIMSRVCTFVNRWRTVVSDPVSQKSLIEWVYSCIPAGTAGERMINEWYMANDPYKSYKDTKITRTAEVTSALKVSDTTWRVEWEETDYDAGLKKKIQRWTGLFTYAISAPKELQAVIKNPIGIYITEFSVNPNLG